MREFSEGHKLADELLAKHGKDRYPTVERKLLKLTEEVGELAKAFNTAGVTDWFTKEFADVGLTLHHIGSALGFDLIDEMRKVVENETRKFA